jgi:hypothetical protein
MATILNFHIDSQGFHLSSCPFYILSCAFLIYYLTIELAGDFIDLLLQILILLDILEV